MPLLHSIDCLRLYVPDLQAGTRYYRDLLDLTLAWKTDHAIGFLFGDGITELVIQDEESTEEIDLKVDDVVDAVAKTEAAGGTIVVPPFPIKIGQCAVIKDPWGNKMVILDTTKGTFITDDKGNIVGQQKT
jgi:predicted enzyme related to lactoylglutathione lyase